MTSVLQKEFVKFTHAICMDETCDTDAILEQFEDKIYKSGCDDVLALTPKIIDFYITEGLPVPVILHDLVELTEFKCLKYLSEGYGLDLYEIIQIFTGTDDILRWVKCHQKEYLDYVASYDQAKKVLKGKKLEAYTKFIKDGVETIKQFIYEFELSTLETDQN